MAGMLLRSDCSAANIGKKAVLVSKPSC